MAGLDGIDNVDAIDSDERIVVAVVVTTWAQRQYQRDAAGRAGEDIIVSGTPYRALVETKAIGQVRGYSPEVNRNAAESNDITLYIPALSLTPYETMQITRPADGFTYVVGKIFAEVVDSAVTCYQCTCTRVAADTRPLQPQSDIFRYIPPTFVVEEVETVSVRMDSIDGIDNID